MEQIRQVLSDPIVSFIKDVVFSHITGPIAGILFAVWWERRSRKKTSSTASPQAPQANPNTQQSSAQPTSLTQANKTYITTYVNNYGTRGDSNEDFIPFLASIILAITGALYVWYGMEVSLVLKLVSGFVISAGATLLILGYSNKRLGGPGWAFVLLFVMSISGLTYWIANRIQFYHGGIASDFYPRSTNTVTLQEAFRYAANKGLYPVLNPTVGMAAAIMVLFRLLMAEIHVFFLDSFATAGQPDAPFSARVAHATRGFASISGLIFTAVLALFSWFFVQGMLLEFVKWIKDL